ncbi:unnamed protein product, partial [Bubo scandiacus]
SSQNKLYTHTPPTNTSSTPFPDQKKEKQQQKTPPQFLLDTYANTKVSGKKRRNGEVCQSRDPLQPIVRGQAVPLQPMEVTSGADADLEDPMEDPMLEQVAVPEEGWDSMGRSPCCCSSVLGGLQHAWGTHAGAAWETLQPMGRTHIGESLWRTASCERETMLEQGKSVRSPPHKEDGVVGLTITPFPAPCATRVNE